MTQPDETPLSPSEQEVQRLLASARHDQPVPPEVAARLDGVLAGLAAGDAEHATATATVTDLDARRRRRRVANLLVAAAAVVAVGIGVGQVIEHTGGSSADSAGEVSAPAAEDGAAGAQRQADRPEAQAQAQGQGAGGGSTPSSGDHTDGLAGTYDTSGRLATVRPQQFDRDVQTLRDRSYDAPDDTLRLDLKSRSTATAVACRSAAWGSGTFVPVSYGGSPGVLVLRRPQGDTQVADLYLCGETVPVRSITLPAP